jgi:hypothetical protein
MARRQVRLERIAQPQGLVGRRQESKRREEYLRQELTDRLPSKIETCDGMFMAEVACAELVILPQQPASRRHEPHCTNSAFDSPLESTTLNF